MRSSNALDRRTFALAVAAPLLGFLVGCDSSGQAGAPSEEAKKARVDRLEKAKAAKPPAKSKSGPGPRPRS